MRISDWSSDVCSSDLGDLQPDCRGYGRNRHKCAGPHHGPSAGKNRGGGSSHARAGRLTWSQRPRSEEHTSELQSLMRTSYAVSCWKKKTPQKDTNQQPENAN